MSRALIIIYGDAERDRAIDWCAKAPVGTRIEFKAARRTLPQNDRLWAALGDIAAQLEWHGQRLRPVDWKLVFLDALKREVRAVPNLDGNGFVNIGISSSDLSKEEFSGLIELIHKFCAEHGVTLHDGAEQAA